MQSGAASMPPVAFRMSCRKGMVSRSTPVSSSGESLPRYRYVMSAVHAVSNSDQ